MIISFIIVLLTITVINESLNEYLQLNALNTIIIIIELILRVIIIANAWNDGTSNSEYLYEYLYLAELDLFKRREYFILFE